jgi:hypothetical protein
MPSEFDVDDKLFECPEGCGRSFNAKALEKHAKVLYHIINLGLLKSILIET